MAKMTREDDLAFYDGKRVFITGHTGFKGIWLSKLLLGAGAELTGFSLASPTADGARLFEKLRLKEAMRSIEGDVRDLAALRAAFREARPEIVLHLAAQPLVRESYRAPVETYAVNVMGTAHVLECVRETASVRSVLNVTTDKVYENREWEWGYREDERLCGFDPYSNSKSCSELVTASYRQSFFADGSVRISTARAGNVIGGGDFSPERIVPDCIRAASENRAVVLRNPHSTRPYQHVLEPLSAYLRIARAQWQEAALAGSYNVGPDDADCVTTGELAELFCRAWGEGASWRAEEEADAPHEAGFLKLDSSRIKARIGWQPRWHIGEAIAHTAAWAKAWRAGEDVGAVMAAQIAACFEEARA